jgi:ADP-heptose:LPS heptosyltransferase
VEGPYVVVHPHASVASRSLAETQTGPIARALLEQGWSVVVTGSQGEQPVRGLPDDPRLADLTGGTSLMELAGVLTAAACVVVGNTGPAHLAAAVGTPVVSLFSPVVPVERWGPWGVPHVVLGDQEAACRGTRAQECPLPGHPCLGGVPPDVVAAAVERLVGRPDGREAPRLESGAVR